MRRSTPCQKIRLELRNHLHLKTHIPALLFVIAILLSVSSTYYATLNYLDGDASSELVLAHHLAETGQILSQDWYYSTELRVLNTQLIYAPLFHIFSDWHMVRFTGALIMQALLVLSFGYLCRQGGLSLGAFFLGATLLISPTSVAYGRIMLYHCYYMPHIILGFLIIGLYLSAAEHWANQTVFSALISSLFMLALSFSSGLGGIRQIIITQLPLLLLIVYRILREDRLPLWMAIRNNLGKLTLCLLSLFAFFVGFVINHVLLSQIYTYSDYTQLLYDIMSAEVIPDLLYGILHQFGFRRQLKILSRSGLISLGSFFIATFCLTRSTYLFIQNREKDDFKKQILTLFFPSSFFLMLCIFFFSNDEWYFPLYLIPVFVWVIPWLCVQYDQLRIANVLTHRADAALLLTLLLYIPSIGINTVFFHPHSDSFSQVYEGLSFHNDKLVMQLQQPLVSLDATGHTVGYSTFWNANTLTELTDGTIRVTGLWLNKDKNLTDNEDIPPSFSYYKWLTLKSYQSLSPEKVFLLLTSSENEYYQQMPFENKGTIIYPDDGHFIIYEFDDPSVLKSMIAW